MKSDFSPIRVLLKALCLFVIFNILYAVVNPQISKVTGYNVLFPGRTRLPFGNPGDPYTVSVDDLDAMFASHLISVPKQSKEYRVALIGDSSVWGDGLGAYEVISEQWNKLNLSCGDKVVRAYDLGYPHPSLMKDMVILDKTMEYEPDLIIWFVTLNTMMSQRTNPFLDANPERVAKLLRTYNISFKEDDEFVQEQPSFYEKTLIGQRSNLARLIKLQMMGIIWTASRADTNTLSPNDLPDFDVNDDLTFHGMEPSDDLTHLLWFEAIQKGQEVANQTPVVIVNEPIFISNGVNASLRYNSLYPRWAYDQYRNALAIQAQKAGWRYLDLWNVVPPEEFTDPTLHITATGERLLVERLNPVLQSMGCN